MSNSSSLRSWVHKHCGNVLVDGNTQYCCTVKISTKTVVDGVETSSFKLCGHPLNKKRPSAIAAHLKTHGLEAPDNMIRPQDQTKIDFSRSQSPTVSPPVPANSREALLTYICTTGSSYSIVDNPALLDFIELYREERNKGAKRGLPHRATLSTTDLDTVYEKCMFYLTSLFGNCSYFAGTTDGWSSSTLQHYWSLTLHGIDKDWNLIECVLACEPIFRYQSDSGVYSAPAIAKILKKILEDCKLDLSKLSALVTDEGGAAPAIPRNITEKLVHVPCGAHRMQTVLKNGFKKSIPNYPLIGAVMTSSKALVRFLKKSGPAKEAFAIIQLKKNEPIIKLVQQVEVRWNSHLLNLQSLAKCPQSIIEFVSTYEDAPASIRFLGRYQIMQLIEQLVSLLEPFAHITQVWSSTKTTTISRVVPCILGLRKALLIIKEELNPRIKSIVDDLFKAIGDHFLPFKRAELIGYALNPRNLPFLDEDSEDTKWLKSGLEYLDEELNEMDSQLAENKNSSGEIDDRGQVTLKFESIPKPRTKIKEIDSYSAIREILPAESENKCPILEFWKQNQKVYPKLALIARKYLCIPAAQSASERAFSQIKHICKTGRANLDPEKAQKELIVRTLFQKIKGISPINTNQDQDQGKNSSRIQSLERTRRRKLARLLNVEEYHSTQNDIVAGADPNHDITDEINIQALVDDEDSSEDESEVEVPDKTSKPTEELETEDGEAFQPPTAKRAKLVENTDGSLVTNNIGKNPRSLRTSRLRSKYVCLEVSKEADDLIYGYAYTQGKELPSFEHIFGDKFHLFCDFKLVEADAEVPVFTFKLSASSKKSFKGSRKTALAVVNNIIQFD